MSLPNTQGWERRHGEKPELQKITTENNASVNYNGTNYTTNITSTTTYIGGFVYESKTYSNGALSSLQYTDELKFLGHEEGRIRFEKAVTTCTPLSNRFIYDYFIKDHLGNVRVVLTEEQESNCYPGASMETAQATTEEAIYSNVNTTRNDLPGGYPTNDTYTNPNNKVAKTNGSGNKIGPAIVLKVMAGDKFNLRVSDWYKTNGATPGTPVSPLTDLLTALTGNVATLSGKFTSTELSNNGILSTGATSFLTNQGSNYTATKPKAFVNWMLFDEQFKYVSSNSGFEQVGGDNGSSVTVHTKTDMPIDKSGYLYVYVSNETPNIDVFFDNLQVTHIRGPLTETNEFYPYGLLQANISYRSLKSGYAENKKKWNKGTELQSKEFSDGSGLELYATPLRSLDPQLGRFWQIDPRPDYSQSLYSSMNNNPISFNDPLGDTVQIRHRGKDIIYNNGALTNQDGSAYGGKVKGFLKQTVNALNSGRTGSAEANAMIGELQSSTNNFTIVKGSTNKFNASSVGRAHANQIQTDPNAAAQLAGMQASGFNFAGGSGGTITWNPSGANVWVVGGGQNNNPTTNLMHEMFHGRDANRGLSDDRDHNGINRSEWQASYKENIVRQQMGLPIREYYRSQDNAGTITPLAPRLLDAANNPILPTWLPAGW